MIYRLDTEFYVTYAIHVKQDNNLYGDWVLKRLDSGRYGLYDFLSENYDRSDGEIAEALEDVINNALGFDDGTRYYTIINFWPI